MNHRQTSPHTIRSYRDTFRLLLEFAQQRLNNKPPSHLVFEEMDARLVTAFLETWKRAEGSRPEAEIFG